MQPIRSDPRAASGTASLDGVDIHYDIGGEGPVLMLISGLGNHAGAWAPVVERLRRDFRTLVFDNRGTGRSSAPHGPYPIDQLAGDAAALILHLGLGPVHAVGWSLGGSVLQSMLINHGGLLRSATLLNAFPNYTPLQHAWLDALIALRRSDAPPAAKASFVMPWGLTPLSLADHDKTMQAVAAALADPWPTGNQGFEAQAAGLRVYDSRADLPRVTTPTLVLTGAEDVLTPVSQSAEIASLIPAARLKVLGKGGHRMVVEYPEEVIRLVTEFVRENDVEMRHEGAVA